MITKNSKVVVNLRDLTSTLVSKGKYSSAKIKVLNAGKKDEKLLILETSKELVRPVFKKASKHITLGFQFIEMALNLSKEGKSRRIEKPRKNASNEEWNIYKNWNNISDEQKIKPHLEDLAYDMKAELINFEILE